MSQSPVTPNTGTSAEAMTMASVSAASASPWHTQRAGAGGSASRRARAAPIRPVAGSQTAGACTAAMPAPVACRALSGLGLIHSAPADNYASTPTLSFEKAHYAIPWMRCRRAP